MKFTQSWLTRHSKIKLPSEKISEALTNIGLEVESIIKPNKNLKNFKVAKIINISKHPNADKLKVCDVDIGKNKIKVVCGADNARKDLVTVFAPPGTIIPKNNLKLEVAKIRGVESFGMLCSESELNISNESSGIIELKNYKLGENFFKSEEDVFDISITPNRSDCLGVKGIARDLYASGYGKVLNNSKISLKFSSKKKTKVSIQKNSGCLQFGSLVIEGVKNCESPSWLKNHLRSIGLKPISAIVDITNFVMIDLNRPMHAYDLDKINKEIIVRKSKINEKFEALDDKEYTLPENSCLITDKSRILGLGGIIGGKFSSISEDTKDILLEAAAFDPISISRTSKKLSLITDAKYRFERGVDPFSIEEGLKLAAKLISQICGGKVGKISIIGKKNSIKTQIKYDPDFFQQKIGFNAPKKKQVEILNKLGFTIKKSGKYLNLQVPTWRPDISKPECITEEILRIIGLDKIPSNKPDAKKINETLNYHQKLFHLLQRSFATRGYKETISWTFTDSKLDKFFSNNIKKIENPISSDLDCLRSSNFTNLLIQLKNNIDRSYTNIPIFEIGPYFKEDYRQKIAATAIFSGNKTFSSWIEPNKEISIFDIKEDLFYILSDIGFDIENLYLKRSLKNYYHPGKSGEIYLNENSKDCLASFGEIHPLITKNIGINKFKPCGFEIYLDNIPAPKLSQRLSKQEFKKSNLQIVERDFAVIFDKNVTAQEIQKQIKNTNPSLIKSIDFFDLYEGENIDPKKKSLAIKVVFEPKNETLKDQEIERFCNDIVSSFKSLGGSLRS